MLIITDKCSEYGHPEFFVYCEDFIPESDVKHFTSWLERAVSAGEVFKPNEILQTGWMINTFFETDDGSLALLEPDMKSFPIAWVPGVTQTLRHMRLQRDLLVSVLPFDDFNIPDIRQCAIVAEDLGEDTKDFYLERTDPKAKTSGWFIGNLNSQINYEDSNNVRLDSLYAVAIKFPQLIMYFGLPAGIRVEIVASTISILRNGSKLEPLPDSFLEMILDGELD